MAGITAASAGRLLGTAERGVPAAADLGAAPLEADRAWWPSVPPTHVATDRLASRGAYRPAENVAWLRRARPHQSLRALGPVPLMLLAALVACAAIAAGLFVTDIA